MRATLCVRAPSARNAWCAARGAAALQRMGGFPGIAGYAAVTRPPEAVTGRGSTPAPNLRLSFAVMDGEKKKLRLSFGYLILGLWAVLLVQQVLSAYLRPNRISYSEFKTAVAQSQVEEVAIGKTLIQGRMKEGAAAAPAPDQAKDQAAKPAQPAPPAPSRIGADD